MQKKGYVYILTNPSFREDWVKIGKSSRPVDIRSKELDNTAVPLPFEIYAWVCTSKYDKIERQLHEILTKLADVCIRKTREFFNIRPEDAFGYLNGLAEIAGDAIINGPDEITDEKNDGENHQNPTKYIVKYTEEFYFKHGLSSAHGKMVVRDGNKFVLLKGAKLDPNLSSSIDYVKKLRKEHQKSLDEDGMERIEEIVFSSPSAAGAFLRGGSCNGKFYWRSKDDRPLSDYIEYK